MSDTMPPEKEEEWRKTFADVAPLLADIEKILTEAGVREVGPILGALVNRWVNPIGQAEFPPEVLEFLKLSRQLTTKQLEEIEGDEP